MLPEALENVKKIEQINFCFHSYFSYYDNEKISIKAPLCSEESIYYSNINEIKYIDQFDFGKKVKGQVNKNYTAGWFNNTEYGDYYLISCNDVEDSRYLYIKSDDKVFIFNVKITEVFSQINTLSK